MDSFLPLLEGCFEQTQMRRKRSENIDLDLQNGASAPAGPPIERKNRFPTGRDAFRWSEQRSTRPRQDYDAGRARMAPAAPADNVIE
jgi:hypothetical protein